MEDFGCHLQGIPKNGEIPSQMMHIEKNLKTLGTQNLLQILTSLAKYFPNAQISVFQRVVEIICMGGGERERSQNTKFYLLGENPKEFVKSMGTQNCLQDLTVISKEITLEIVVLVWTQKNLSLLGTITLVQI